MGPTGKTQVVQIHPTQRCNLRCRHCYSSSSPNATETLKADLLKSTLDELAGEDYNWVSFSGGEPLMYKPLPSVLSHAKQVGMNTAVVSNGMLLTPRRLDAIRHVTDLLVISLDGTPTSHNRTRNSPNAFEAMATKLPELQARGISFGFRFTLTRHNLDELPWVAEFALNVGAKLLQIHPLEYAGNAREQMAGMTPGGVEGARASYLAQEMQQLFGGQVAFKVDMVRTEFLHRQPEGCFLDGYGEPLHGRLGELLSPLVIEPDGTVVPTRYGFDRSYALGNLHQQRIRDMATGWRTDTGPRFHALCRQLYDSMCSNGQDQFFNWHERLAAHAQQQSPAMPLALPFPAPISVTQPSGASTLGCER